MPLQTLDTIRAVVFPEGSGWVAHCLEIDLAACAETLEELPARLLEQLRAQAAADRRRGHAAFAKFQPAPEKYWRMYEKARPWRTERMPITLFGRLRQGLTRRNLPAQVIELAAIAA